MEAGRSWPDLSSLERVLIQDYWTDLPNTPFIVIRKAQADLESNHLLMSLFQRKPISVRAESMSKKSEVADQLQCHTFDKCCD